MAEYAHRVAVVLMPNVEIGENKKGIMWYEAGIMGDERRADFAPVFPTHRLYVRVN